MKRQILGVLDTEIEYSRRLCNFISEHQDYPFDAICFSNEEKLMTYLESQKLDVLLIARTYITDEIRELVQGKVLVLSKNGVEKGEIYKYQEADKILKAVLPSFDGDVDIRESKNKNTTYIGLYTPVHRCLQTTFAVTMGQLLAKNEKVLYLNFESYSGFSEKLHKTYNGDATDIIYLINTGANGMYYKFQAMIESIGNLDYLPPIFSPYDLYQISQDDWFRFFDYLEENLGYDYIILDLGESLQGLLNILNRCKYVYTLLKEDSFAMAKLKQYQEMLIRMNYTELENKTKKLKIPVFKSIPLEFDELPYSDIAVFAKDVIREMKSGA